MLPLKERIDARLQRIANVLLLNASFIDNLGLLNGKMGIAIFFYHYARYTGNDVYSDYAGELIDEIYEEISAGTPTDFENGLTGIGWGIEYLVKNMFVQADTDEVLAEIDTFIYRSSLYTPKLIETSKDMFGYGFYYLSRLREHGCDNNNLNTLFKKQHLIYLLDDCERFLIQKKHPDFNIQTLSINTINSLAWFLLEVYRWNIFPFKVEKLLHALPEHLKVVMNISDDISGIVQLCKLIEYLIPCIHDTHIRDLYKSLLNVKNEDQNQNNLTDEYLVNRFIKETYQKIFFEPYHFNLNTTVVTETNIIQIIDNSENWNNRLNNLNCNNIGLTGMAGLGLGLIQAQNKGLLPNTKSQGINEVWQNK